jgi:adenine phosphoribosyltransferase
MPQYHQLETQILGIIRTIPDFPKKGIEFKDISPLLSQPELCRTAVAAIVDAMEPLRIEAVVGVESRVFLLGPLIAQGLHVPFIPIRKEGRIPGNTSVYSYNMEYGTASIEIHSDDIPEHARVLLHDDILATGGTAAAAAELIRQSGANVVAFAFILHLSFLNGVEQLLPFTDKIFYLAEE